MFEGKWNVLFVLYHTTDPLYYSDSAMSVGLGVCLWQGCNQNFQSFFMYLKDLLKSYFISMCWTYVLDTSAKKNEALSNIVDMFYGIYFYLLFWASIFLSIPTTDIHVSNKYPSMSMKIDILKIFQIQENFRK